MTTPAPLKLARDALASCNSNDGDDPWYDAEKVREALAAIDALPASAQTGGSPEHMLQDQSRELSRWLSNQPGARLHATEAAAAIARASVPSGEPVVRCELVGSCRKCRHAVGRQSCALARRDIEGAGIPDWCPLPAYRATAQAAPAPAPMPPGWRIEAMGPGYAVHAPNGAGCIVREMEDEPRVVPTEVLAMLCRDLLAARTQAPAAPAVAAPEPRTLTAAQIERHGMPASECPPDSVVMLVSSIRRLLGMAAAPTTQEPQQ